MTEIESPFGLRNIGEEAKPPFAAVPNPATLFITRAKRLRELAPGHLLEPYLNFVAYAAEAQHRAQAHLPEPVLPPADKTGQALKYGLPPLLRTEFEPGEAEDAALAAFLARLSECSIPDEARAAISALTAASPQKRCQLMGGALKDAPVESIPERVLVLAGLQIVFARMAAKLGAGALNPVADSACPVCGSPPMTTSVVGWPQAHNSRYCSCSLCSTMWNAVRVKCVLCSSTEGIAYHSIEGGPEQIKAETCEKCGHYVKILYQVKDHKLDPFSDDVGSLDLDMLLAQEGWVRGGHNPFLLGY